MIIGYNSTFWKFRQNNRQFTFDEAKDIFETSNQNIKYCKTFDEWNAIGRRIIKGEKSIKYEDKDGKKGVVFDISQTKGAPLETIIYPSYNYLVDKIDQINIIKIDKKAPNYYSALAQVVRNSYQSFVKEDNANKEEIIEATTGILYSIIGGIKEFGDLSVNVAFEADKLMNTIYNNIYERSKKNERNENLENIGRNVGELQSGEGQNGANDRGVDGNEETRNSRESQKLRKIREYGETNDEGNKPRIFAPTETGNERGHILRELGRENSELSQPRIEQSSEIEHGRHDGEYKENKGAGSGTGGNNNGRIYNASNFDRTRELAHLELGQKGRFKCNVDAIKLLKELEQEQRNASSEEQGVLARYVGWGGISQAFDINNETWRNEYKELKSLLSESEYNSAQNSTLSAHYTSNTIIESIYKAMARMGLRNGKVLEPACGIGNFVGLLPNTFDQQNVYGVEIDAITGKIAQQLYPQSNIQIKGFEETNFENSSFDSVITNVPFGAFKVFDRDYNRENLFVHDYFILKSLDKTKSGGICAFITSKGTLDKTNSRARKLFAQRAELVGAIRLPNTAFKKSANTEVTSDILFFKKRETKIDEPTDSWQFVGENQVGIRLNEYFIDNPQMMLGQLVKATNMYGDENDTALLPFDNITLEDSLSQAIENLPQNIFEAKNIEEKAKSVTNIEVCANVKNFAYFIHDGDIYQKENDVYNKIVLPLSVKPRIIDLINIKEQMHRIIDLELENCSDQELTQAQCILNEQYDNFVKKNGIINSSKNINHLHTDCDRPLVSSLEKTYNEDKNTAEKGDIFTKRTIKKYEPVTHTESVSDALLVSLSELGRVDIKKIETLTDKPYSYVVENLDGLIYKNPLVEEMDEKSNYDGWETAEQYLSGNVKEKLQTAQNMAQDHSEYNKNVEALLKVVPEDIPASDIGASIGATWIDKKYYGAFMCNKFRILYHSLVDINFNEFSGEWSVGVQRCCINDVINRNKYGTSRMSAVKIFQHCLNHTTINVYDKVNENDRVLNKTETALAREKARILQEEFRDWIFEEPRRREELVKKYNDTFNNLVLPNFNGSYLNFPHMNTEIQLRQHQLDAVHRIISNGNTLLHHCVGSGKTYTMVSAAMKLREFGLANKPMIVVPNHLVTQWANDFNTLYPTANVLMATKKDFEKENRLKFVSRIATGDWDAVVISASSFEKISVSKERQIQCITKELEKIREAQMTQDRSDKISVKNLAKSLKIAELKLQKLMESTKDDILNFEQLGVDYLFVDEAHMYKNKGVYTKMSNVAGISTTASKRAVDMEMKANYINEVQGGQKGVVFATGTPISNSMTEMYIMQSFLQGETLKQCGLSFFDGWAVNFGEQITALELAPSGNGYRTKTRFSKFTNLPELQKLYRQVADVKTAEMLNLPTPKCKKEVIKTPSTETTTVYNENIMERAEMIAHGSVDPTIDNMLKITGDGKKLALDPRLYNRDAPDEQMSKINFCVEKVFSIWQATQEKRSTQIIFCDMSTPKCAFDCYDPQTDFDVYNDVKYKLVQRGIPAEEIKFIHEAGNNEKQKQRLFDDVNNGDVRILMGSTAKCGAGTNMQKKLLALHHLDTPYRPSDLEQREGRIVRQGNDNEEVFIYTYVTEKTFDSYSYQILENKQKFISQIDKGDMTLRVARDIDDDTFSYGEIKAMVTANPMIKRKMEIEQELSRLTMLENAYKKERYKLQDNVYKIYPQEIVAQEARNKGLKEDIATTTANKNDGFFITLNNKAYVERKLAGDALRTLAKSVKGTVIGNYAGLDIIADYNELWQRYDIRLRGKTVHNIEMFDSNLGNIIKIENVVKSFEKMLADGEERLSSKKESLAEATSQLKNEFEHKETILALKNELAHVDAMLDLDKKEEEVIIDDANAKEELSLSNPIVRIESNFENISSGEYSIFDIEDCLQKERCFDSSKYIKYKIITNINNEEYQEVGLLQLAQANSIIKDIATKIDAQRLGARTIESDSEKEIVKNDIFYKENILLPYLSNYLIEEKVGNAVISVEAQKEIKNSFGQYKKIKQQLEEDENFAE